MLWMEILNGTSLIPFACITVYLIRIRPVACLVSGPLFNLFSSTTHININQPQHKNKSYLAVFYIPWLCKNSKKKPLYNFTQLLTQYPMGETQTQGNLNTFLCRISISIKYNNSTFLQILIFTLF